MIRVWLGWLPVTMSDFSLYNNAAAGVCEAFRSIKDHLRGQAGRPGRGGNLSPPAAISAD